MSLQQATFTTTSGQQFIVGNVHFQNSGSKGRAKITGDKDVVLKFKKLCVTEVWEQLQARREAALASSQGHPSAASITCARYAVVRAGMVLH